MSSRVASLLAGLLLAAPLLSSEDAQQLIIQHLTAIYDGMAGYRLLQHLQQRCPDAPVPQQATALALGAYFPLMAYRAPVRQLAMHLVDMECARRIEFANPDVYRRGPHILRCAGTPGLGKSTAAEALWPALHQAWQSSEFLASIGAAAGAAATADVTKLKQRLLNSLAPERLLVFKLAFNAGKTRVAACMQSPWHATPVSIAVELQWQQSCLVNKCFCSRLCSVVSIVFRGDGCAGPSQYC